MRLSRPKRALLAPAAWRAFNMIHLPQAASATTVLHFAPGVVAHQLPGRYFRTA